MSPETQFKSESLETVSTVETIREEDKMMLLLAYFSIFSVIPLVTVKDSGFVQWHAKQGFFLMAAWIACWVAGIALWFIPVIGWLLSIVCIFVAPLGLLILDILAMLKAFGGERWRIPVVADIADRF